MANRRFTQFLYSLHNMPVLLDCNIAIGSTGAVGTVKGPGILGVTRLSAGTYKIQFQDNYYKYFGMDYSVNSGVTGSNITAGSFVATTSYVITAVGTTNWNAIGLPTGITAAAGQGFVATGIGSGTGTAKIVAPSGIVTIESLGDPSLQLAPTLVGNQGGYIIIQCMASTSSSVTTLIATDPVIGAQLYLRFYLSNSSVTVQGE